jgi:hypothetical protein
LNPLCDAITKCTQCRMCNVIFTHPNDISQLVQSQPHRHAHALLYQLQIVSNTILEYHRGKLPIMGRCPNMGRCIISHQVLRLLLKNVNHQADETVLSNHGINGPLLRTSVLTGRLCFGVLWNFCLSLNCDSWAVEGMLFFWISLVLSSLLSVILKTCFGSLVEF